MSRKQIYDFLCDLIAYSVMLSLPEDGQWRHGIWSTEAMETHFRLQASGVCLLSSYYEKKKRPLFLDKACKAMDYILSKADDLQNEGLWFLHDSLEQAEFWNGYCYKNDIVSDAFGKSKYNTLCLNTHIWTILALYQLKKLSKDSRYETFIERGLNALKQVLTVKPAEWLYRPAYYLRDIFISRYAKNTAGHFTRNAKKNYEKILGKSVLPFLKRKYPRLVMPNGFIERDLTHSQLSGHYHLGTLDDLMILYAHHSCDWLKEIITRSVDYTHNSGFLKSILLNHSASTLYLEILLLYSALIDDSYLRLLSQYMTIFEEHNIVTISDVISNKFICSHEIGLSVNNNMLKVLTVNYHRGIMGLVINPQAQSQNTNIDIHFLSQMDKKDVMIARSNGSEVSSLFNVNIPPYDFVKVMRR